LPGGQTLDFCPVLCGSARVKLCGSWNFAGKGNTANPKFSREAIGEECCPDRIRVPVPKSSRVSEGAEQFIRSCLSDQANRRRLGFYRTISNICTMEEKIAASSLQPGAGAGQQGYWDKSAGDGPCGIDYRRRIFQ
jgi:hypothetical protein